MNSCNTWRNSIPRIVRLEFASQPDERRNEKEFLNYSL